MRCRPVEVAKGETPIGKIDFKYGFQTRLNAMEVVF